MKSNRREFFQIIGLGGAGLSLASPFGFLSCTSTSRKKENGQVLFIGADIAVSETTYGKVQGYKLRDIYYFLGIPYGADTSGANRFMPPQKPEPWSDIYPAICYGESAPQGLGKLSGSKFNSPSDQYPKYAKAVRTFHNNWRDTIFGENCLTINVFTPGYGDSKKRPVLFWMHGGGFIGGSSHDIDCYNGENFTRFGDIVFCSINHRLGPMGFANFSGIGGEKYAASGNVGMLDIVAALEWVKDNIANFGGDPNNVTIMGQSGGGRKVTTITAMPSAKGLFHKAVVLSGAGIMSGEKDISEKLGSYILKEAGLSALKIDKLQQMTWQDFYMLADNANTKLVQELGRSSENFFSPVVDGIYLPQHPYYSEPTPLAADIPMIICCTTEEESPDLHSPLDYSNITFNEVIKIINERYSFGEIKSKDVVDAYSKAFPDKKPIEIWALIISSQRRLDVAALANSKSKQSPPVYVAWFGWQPPLFNGKLRALHSTDISFWFYNTDIELIRTGGGARPRSLSTKMAGSLLQFMKTGDPNGGGLPEWPRYTSDKGELMFLNDISEVQYDPDREARKTFPGSL